MTEQARATYADVELTTPLDRVVNAIQRKEAECFFCRKRREIGMAKFEARKDRERKVTN